MEKQKITQEKKLSSYEKIMRKEARLFNEKVFFIKKFRENVREHSFKLLDLGSKILTSMSLTSKERVEAKNIMHLARVYLRVIRAADKYEKFSDQRGTFALFNDKNTYIFSCKTLRDKKIRQGNLIFPNGLPEKTFKKALYRRKEKPPTGFIPIDLGQYHFKQTGNYCGYYHFSGKLEEYFIDYDKIKTIEKDKAEMKCRLSKNKEEWLVKRRVRRGYYLSKNGIN